MQQFLLGHLVLTLALLGLLTLVVVLQAGVRTLSSLPARLALHRRHESAPELTRAA